MLHLIRAIDRATGYVFVPSSTSAAPPGTVDDTNAPLAARPNSFALFSSAAGPMRDPGSDIRDIQERWVDAKDEYDAYEKKQWRRECEIVRDEAAKKNTIRERK